ncbi:hypothetical protein GWI33_011377, partial [Rhynchophorus ferrugineus]
GHKQRSDGDGMDSSIEDSAMEMSERHLTGDYQCACDHMIYSPTAYTCLQVLLELGPQIASESQYLRIRCANK